MTFALICWIVLCLMTTAFIARELYRAERAYLDMLNAARSNDDLDHAAHAWKEAQTFWLAAWALVCFMSGIAVLIVETVSK